MYGFFWWDSFKKELDKGYLILILEKKQKLNFMLKKMVMYFHYFIKEKKSDLKPILKYLKKECL